jgi:acyl-CoA synthetase (NDP forming)
MVGPGVELVLGARRDPQYGPAVLIGLGGVLAEAIDDVAVALAPVRSDRAHALLRELRGAPILAGARGRPAVDRDAIADILVRLGALLEARPEIVEIDINPVIAAGSETVAVDALVVIEDVS